MRLVPSQRLLLCGALLMPIALLAIISPVLGWAFPTALAILMLLSLIDLARSSKVLAGLSMQAEPVTRLSRGTPGKLAMHIRCEGTPPSELTLGLPLPVEFEQEKDIQRIHLSNSATNFWTIYWHLTGRARGVFSCPPIYAESSSLWGLFCIRRSFANKAVIRVYPNLRRERRQLANLFMNRGHIGVHAQRMAGQGREYEQLREYSTGDSLLDIHWKASAKRGELVTKTYQIERTQEIYLIIDHSRLSGLRSTREEHNLDDDYAETILERYVTAASVLSLVAERQGDLFGLVAFGQRVSRYIRASSGRQHGQVVQDALFDLKTERGPFDLNELFTFLRLRLRRRALLIILTDLSDAAAAEEFNERIRLISSRHVVLINSIRRPGVQPLYANPEAVAESGISEQIAGHLRWSGLRELQLEMQRHNVDFSVLDDEKLSVDLVNQYLSIKQRQIL